MVDSKFLNEFCEKFGYPKEAEETLNKTLLKLNGTEAEKELQYYIDLYNNDNLPETNDFLKDFTAIAEKVKVSEWSLRLLYLISLVPHLRELYKAKNIPLEICENTVADLKYKMIECFKVKKVYGIFVDWWDIGFFRMKRFGLGRCQFELFKSPIDYHENGFNINTGDKVVELHVPSSGPLIREEYLESYRRAAEFFKDEFYSEVIFFAESWLLYPEKEKFLKPTSNIFAFANDFNIAKVIIDEKGEDLWRIFDTEELPENLDELPEETSMQKSIKKYLKDGNYFGLGLGFFAYKDGKIIR